LIDSTCFGHYYAHRQENKTVTPHVVEPATQGEKKSGL